MFTRPCPTAMHLGLDMSDETGETFNDHFGTKRACFKRNNAVEKLGRHQPRYADGTL